MKFFLKFVGGAIGLFLLYLLFMTSVILGAAYIGAWL